MRVGCLVYLTDVEVFSKSFHSDLTNLSFFLLKSETTAYILPSRILLLEGIIRPILILVKELATNDMSERIIIPYFCSNSPCNRTRIFVVYADEIFGKLSCKCTSCGCNSEEALAEPLVQDFKARGEKANSEYLQKIKPFG